MDNIAKGSIATAIISAIVTITVAVISNWQILIKKTDASTEFKSIEEKASKVSSQLQPFPIGSVMAFAGDVTKIPLGWKLCDGSVVSKTENQELFDAIGYYWGQTSSGDFKLPDLRGQFLRGVDNNANIDPNINDRHELIQGQVPGFNPANVGSYQDDEFKAHQHKISAEGSTNNKDNTNNITNMGGPEGGQQTSYPAGGDETRPKNVYVNFIIRLK